MVSAEISEGMTKAVRTFVPARTPAQAAMSAAAMPQLAAAMHHRSRAVSPGAADIRRS